MFFLRRYKYVLLFLVVMFFCSVMVVREFIAHQNEHVETREDFILLHSRGYTNEARMLYARLLKDIVDLNDKQLMDDFQRTVILVDPYTKSPENLIWNYHWTISNELDKRSENTLKRALKRAEKK